MGKAAEHIGRRAELLIDVAAEARRGRLYISLNNEPVLLHSLERRFNDCLAPDDESIPEFIVKHADNAVAGLAGMICLRRYFSPLDEGLRLTEFESKA